MDMQFAFETAQRFKPRDTRFELELPDSGGPYTKHDPATETWTIGIPRELVNYPVQFADALCRQCALMLANATSDDEWEQAADGEFFGAISPSGRNDLAELAREKRERADALGASLRESLDTACMLQYGTDLPGKLGQG